MCKLDHRLKLCTCRARSTAALTHSWVFHRFDAKKSRVVIGRVALPPRLAEEIEQHNRALLLSRLNEADAFDVELSPREGDRLQLSFRFSDTKWAVYGYEHRDGRWTEQPFSPLEWQWHHDQESFGVVRGAVPRSRPKERAPATRATVSGRRAGR